MTNGGNASYVNVNLTGCSVSRCNRKAEFTLLHFMIFH